MLTFGKAQLMLRPRKRKRSEGVRFCACSRHLAYLNIDEPVPIIHDTTGATEEQLRLDHMQQEQATAGSISHPISNNA